MKKFKVMHPFLFALFPVLSLYSYNIDEMGFREILLPAGVILCFSILTWILLTLMLRNKNKAGIITTIFLFLFFSYGHIFDNIYDLIRSWKMHEEHFLYFWGSLYIVVSIIIIVLKKDFNGLTRYLNLFSIFLVIIPLLTVGYNLIFAKNVVTTQQNLEQKVNMEETKRYPDIYYIILDGYGRSDILKYLYSHDNTPFLKYLKEKGFYIASKSKSNYPQTAFSLASSLNLTYLDRIIEKMGTNSQNRNPLRKMIKNSKAAQFLKNHGYTTIAFATGIAGTEINNADVYLTPKWFLSEFENVLINTTPLPILLEKLTHQSQHDLHRERVLYILDKLAYIPDKYSPFFVFAHVICPHPPFLFDENGKPVVAEKKFSFADGRIMKIKKYVKYYTKQLTFVTKKIQKTVDKILEKSQGNCIIILQADHGPGARLKWSNYKKLFLKERMTILNAYYLPDKGKKYLYSRITPVNSFAVIFNACFNGNFELLEDKIFYSGWNTPYRITNITEALRE